MVKKSFISMDLHKKLKLHIVSHTHWDREWYLTFQQFRVMLVKMLDSLIDIFQTVPGYAHFILDGQTIILDDYLALRPEKKDVIKKLIREGKIIIGPWFVASDLFCVSGESLVRNLKKGIEMARSFGGCQNVGYMIDQFGFNSQIPQILLGFGISKAVGWRGIFSYENEKSDAVFWKSPDESTILLACLPELKGYFNAVDLSEDFNESLRLIKNCVEALAKHSRTGDILLMNGVDHHYPTKDIPLIIKRFRKLYPQIKIEQSTIESYIKEISKETNRKTLYGELRNSVFNDIMRGTLSSRMDIKVKNEQVETSLIYEAEPLSVLSEVFTGRAYPLIFLEEAWRILLLNHAHDSIGGCSIDQVHKEMFNRYDESTQISNLHSELSKYAISKNVKDPPKADCKIVIFNTSSFPRNDICFSELLFPLDLIKRELSFRIFDGDKKVDYYILNKYDSEVRFNYFEKKFERVIPIKIAFPVENIPAFGYKTLSLKWVENKQKVEKQNEKIRLPFKVSGDKIEIQFNQDATIDILDRGTGEYYERLNRFVDYGDRGDSYNYCSPENDDIIKSKGDNLKVKCICDNDSFAIYEVSQVFNIPKELNQDRCSRSDSITPLNLTSCIMFYKKGERIDIETRVLNTAKDHRLKVVFPTNRNTDFELAETQFDIIRRKCDIVEHKDWYEQPQPEKPQQNFVLIYDDKGGLAIGNKGILEYSISKRPERAIELTLLRCFEWGSRGDLYNTKRGKYIDEAGRAEQAKEFMFLQDSQMQGTYVFHYSIVPLTPSKSISEAVKASYSHKVPLKAIMQKCEKIGKLKNKQSLITIYPEDIIVTAFKRSRNDDAYILRLYNWDEKTKNVKLKIIRSARIEIVNLNEDRVDETIDCKIVREENNIWKLKCNKKKIVTLKIYPNKNN